MKFLSVMCVGAAAVLALAGPANAQTAPVTFSVTVTGHAGYVTGGPSDHFLTFSDPVEVPGVGLAPGAYVFRFVSNSVVQVLSGDRKVVFGMFSTIPATRAGDVSGDYAMTLQRVRDDVPPRITQWFLPNQSIGYEFIYPKEKEAETVAFVAMK